MSKALKNTRGFTMIELMVVISIIAMLSSVILASLVKARDKGRIGNLLIFSRNMQNVLYARGSSLQVYYPFNEGGGLNTKSIFDINDITLQSSGMWSSITPAGPGFSLIFNGSNKATLTNSIPFNPLVPMTIAFWIKTTSTGPQPIFFTAGGDLSIELTAQGKIRVDNTFSDNSSGASVNDGNWHHVIWSFPTSITQKIYVDSKLDTSPTTELWLVPPGPPTETYIGYNPSGTYFNGSIDDFNIFNTAY